MQQASLLDSLYVFMFCFAGRTILTLICLYSDDNWHVFMKRFTTSVENITGQALDVRAASDDNQSSVQEEIERLKKQVDELKTEVCRRFYFILKASSHVVFAR